MRRYFFDNPSFCNKLSELFDVESATIKNIFSKKNERSRNSKLNHEIHKFLDFPIKFQITFIKRYHVLIILVRLKFQLIVNGSKKLIMNTLKVILN